MKKGMFVALAIALGAPGIARAQAGTAEERPAAQDNRRHAIRMMEAVLSRAVLGGAEHLAEQLASGNPSMSFFTGQARARGFVLEGYGVFFHVEIPEMQQSLLYSLTTLERGMDVAQALEPLVRVVESAPDTALRLQAEKAIERLRVQFAPVPPPPAATVAPPGAIRSAEARSEAAASDVADDPSIPPQILRDPNGAYRDAIKAALIDAMLEHSRGMNIRPDEWLTVAARRGDSPLAPNEIVTSSTLVLRIKGSDLALYDVDRSRKEDVRQRVEVREF